MPTIHRTTNFQYLQIPSIELELQKMRTSTGHEISVSLLEPYSIIIVKDKEKTSTEPLIHMR